MRLFTFIPFMVFFFSFSVQASTLDLPAGPLAEGPAIFQYALYLVEPVKEDPILLAERILKETGSDFKLTAEPEPGKNSIRIRLSDSAQKDYSPPTLESLRYFGKGISKEQADKLQQVDRAIIIDFAVPLKSRASGLNGASRYILNLSVATRGVIWDEETRECFSHEAWRATRINSFKDGVPDISSHITIHAYRDGEYIRAITLGMAKFGLPDIEVSDFSWSANRSVGNLINLVAQLSYDVGSIPTKGEFILNVENIQHQTIKKEVKESLFENAKNQTRIRVVKGTRDEGDPDNRIMEIAFDTYPGKNKQEKIASMLAQLWGWKDDIVQVRHNAAILAASEKAKTKLPEIRKKIQDGLAPGEYYMVKAPFATPDGNNEWMWVEVQSWKDNDNIIGFLKNQPLKIPDLKSGAMVTVKAIDVFDYIHRLPDGSSEGNETGALIQKYFK